MSNPAFQFYPKQWLGDDTVLLMDWDARGMHLHFMCIAWQQDNPCTLPDDDEVLRKWVGNPKGWERLKKQIFRAWKLKDGRWVQEGLLRVYEKQIKFSKSRSDNALKRWDKTLEEQTDDASALQVQCKCDALQFSSSSSLPNNGTNVPLYVLCDQIIDYLNAKRNKRFRRNETNRKNIRARLSEGYTVDDCKKVIDTKHHDPHFIDNPKYFNPETLFRPSHFENYLQESPDDYKRNGEQPSKPPIDPDFYK